MRRRVVVTGLGCVSGLGGNVAETWARAAAGEGAIRPIDRHEGLPPQARMTGPAAPVVALDLTALERRLGPRALAGLDPFSTFAAVAALEALEQAGLLDEAVLTDEAAILVGCGSGGNATYEAGYRRLYERGLSKIHPQTIPLAMTSAPASQIATLFGMHGPCFVLASACASSAHALGEALWMIRSGRVPLALAGGTEACLTPGSWAGWRSLGVLASESCRPFSAGRDGMVLGEGAAMLVLEERDHALARGAAILGELIGYGAGSDAGHITTPDQAGIERAIRAAHRDAGLPLDTPLLISSHGTGTPVNDRVEAAAMRAVYGAALAGSVVIATKSAHGHLIGGTGALELVIGLKALAARIAPPLLNWTGADPACDLPLALEARPLTQSVLVSNSFAFGGLNAVLVARV